VSNSRLKAMIGVQKLVDAFQTLKAAFVEGKGQSLSLANTLDHTQLALESAGVDVGPPPALADELDFEESDEGLN
jgi:hypothetical protein